MKKAALLCLLILTSLLFTACVPSPAATVPPATSAPMTEVPVETSVPSQASEPPALEAARQALASQLGIDPSAVEITAYERAEWPDSCLGLPEGDEACAQVITPGYRVTLEAGGKQYEFHTDETGGDVRLAADNDLALAWHREGGIAGFCDDLEIYLTGSAFATSCKGAQPQQGDRFRLDASQLQQLYEWTDSLKSFEVNQTDPATADAMTIRLVFSGMGEVEAGEAEKAAIQEFAAEVYASREEQGTPSAGQETPSPDLEAARQALLAYFTALNAGRFEEATGYFGGSYEILMGYNPEVPSEDHEALLDAACRYNGFQCLKVREIVKADQVSPDEFTFTVQFANPDGSLFQRRPCCTVDSSQSPLESDFTYTVVKNDGKYLVQELPVYVP